MAAEQHGTAAIVYGVLGAQMIQISKALSVLSSLFGKEITTILLKVVVDNTIKAKIERRAQDSEFQRKAIEDYCNLD